MYELKTTPTRCTRPLTRAGILTRRPKYRLPAQGMSADAAYQLVHDELNLDGNPSLNLASFVTSWMEPQADRARPGDARQEPDRPGRVPTDGGGASARGEHDRKALPRARRRGADRYRDDRLLRGDHAGDAGP